MEGDRPGGRRRNAGPPGGRVTNPRLGIEQLEDARRGRDAHVAGMPVGIQFDERPEALGGEEEDDQQRGDAQLAGGHLEAPDADGERHAAAHREPDQAVADHRDRELRHGGAVERVARRAELFPAPFARVERLQRDHALHRVDELRIQRRIRGPVPLAVLSQDAVPDSRDQRHGQREGQDDAADQRIEQHDEADDADRNDDRHHGMRQVVADIHLERLDTIDQGRLHLAGLGVLQVTGSKQEQLSEEPAAQPGLDGGCDPLRQDFADEDQRRANQRQAGDGGDEPRDLGPATPVEDSPHDQRDEHPLGDPGRGDGKTERDGEGEEPAHANGQPHDSPVDHHLWFRASAARSGTSPRPA